MTVVRCQRCLQVCLLLRRPDSPPALKMRLAELLVVTLSHLMAGDASHGSSSQLMPQTQTGVVAVRSKPLQMYFLMSPEPGAHSCWQAAACHNSYSNATA